MATMAICKWWQGNSVVKAVLENMSKCFCLSVAVWEKNSGCYSKSEYFIAEKEYLIKSFVLKRRQVSVNNC